MKNSILTTVQQVLLLVALLIALMLAPADAQIASSETTESSSATITTAWAVSDIGPQPSTQATSSADEFQFAVIDAWRASLEATQLTRAALIEALALAIATYAAEPVDPPVDPPVDIDPPVEPPLDRVSFEDFSIIRLNGRGDPLWSPTNNPNQTVESAIGEYRVAMEPADGIREGHAWYSHFYPNQGAPRYPEPEGFVHGNLLSGDWDPEINRMGFWLKCDTDLPANQRRTFYVGTYIKPLTADPQPQGQHYYNFFGPAIHANRWIRVVVTATPTALVGTKAYNIPPDPEWSAPTGAEPVHYFDGMTRFYLSITGTGEPMTCSIDDFTLWNQLGEPEALVANMTASYSGTGYEVSWITPKGTAQDYEVRYDPLSMKTAGFEAGVDGGTVSSRNSAYATAVWVGPTMAEQPTMVFAIRPVGSNEFTEIELRTRQQ